MSVAKDGKPRAHRGFAAMEDKERHREISRKGGSSHKPEDRAFSKDRDLASSAGQKGGKARRGLSRAHRT